MHEENVLVITVDEPASVVQVVETLTRLRSEGELELRAAATIHRSADGRISVEDQVADADADTDAEPGPARRHPRLAGLLAVLAGPLDTLLFGNSLMALAGALAVRGPDEPALEHLARSIPPGTTAVVADVRESDPTVVDRELTLVGGRAARRPVGEVEAEVAAADAAVRSAGTEARRVLRDTRHGSDASAP